jgi:hypothetical protein
MSLTIAQIATDADAVIQEAEKVLPIVATLLPPQLKVELAVAEAVLPELQALIEKVQQTLPDATPGQAATGIAAAAAAVAKASQQ